MIMVPIKTKNSENEKIIVEETTGQFTETIISASKSLLCDLSSALVVLLP